MFSGWAGRLTFCPIISERLNFKGRGFRDSDLGSLALLGVYDGQSSNANWGSCGGWLKMQNDALHSRCYVLCV